MLRFMQCHTLLYFISMSYSFKFLDKQKTIFFYIFSTIQFRIYYKRVYKQKH